MSRYIQLLGRPSVRLAARLRNARPGSVLILVVALLVLMALIGTAWLTTARNDRYGAQQNTYNTQVDLLLEAVKTLAKSAIVDDLFGGSQYRPAPGSANTDYENYDAPGVRDPYLASRIPSNLAAAPAVSPAWRAITRNPAGAGFESPFATDTAGTPVTTGLPVKYTDATNIVPNGINVPSTGGGATLTPAFNVTVGTATRVVAADTDGDGIADAGLFRLPVGNLSGVTYYGAIRIIDNNSAINLNTAWEASADAGQQFFPSNINIWPLLNTNDPDASDTVPARTRASQIVGLNKVRFTADTSDDHNLAAMTLGLAPIRGNGVARGDFTFISQAEAFWRQSGSRLKNPGYALVGPVPGNKFSPLPIGEQMALASRFILRSPFANRTLLEDKEFRLGHSLFDNAPSAPYDPDDVTAWYNQNFNYPPFPATAAGGPQPSIRSLVVTSNPVSGGMPGWTGSATSGQPWSGTAAYRFGDRVTYGDRGYVAMFNIGVPTSPTNPTPDAQGTRDFAWAQMSWRNHPMKASINTASFGELWMAFLGAMDERGMASADPVAPYPSGVIADARATSAKARRQFRSVMRNPTSLDPVDTDPNLNGINRPTPVGETQMVPAQVMKLRAALAAVNAIDLRDSDRDVTARRIVLNAHVLGTPLGEIVDVNVYGYEPQPFITEVYVSNFDPPDPGGRGGGPNLKGYVAIELYNPYPFAISLAGWQLGIVDRRPVLTGTTAPPPNENFAPDTKYHSRYPFMTMQGLSGFTGFDSLKYADTPPTPAAPVVPAGGYLILENYAHEDPDPTLDEKTLWEQVYDNHPRVSTDPADATAVQDLRDDLKHKLDDAASYRPLSSRLTFPTAGGDTTRFFVPGLHEVLMEPGNNEFRGGELYLLRPRRADGTLTYDDRRGQSGDARPPSAFPYDERLSDWLDPTHRGAALAELVPVDSVDFAGMKQIIPAASTGVYQLYHYSRPSGGANQWRCMFPGRWDATTPWDTSAPVATVLQRRQEGIDPVTWDFGSGDPEPWTTTSMIQPPTPINLGGADGAASYQHNFPAMQLSLPDAAGWNRVLNSDGTLGAGPFTFPFGGFARNGDILQVPFIGRYRIRPRAAYLPVVAVDATPYPNGFVDLNPFLELNAITQDMALAHDADTRYGSGDPAVDHDNDPANDGLPPSLAVTDDADEQVGRFWPIEQSPRNPVTTMPPVTTVVSDFLPLAAGNEQRYAWTGDLFDYLTVQSPQDDYMPNVDPALVDYGMDGRATDPIQATPARADGGRKYPTAAAVAFTSPPVGQPPQYPTDPDAPEPISNLSGGNYTNANAGREDAAGTDGLINVNTASVEVLATVPWVPFASPPTDGLTFDPATGAMASASNTVDDNYDIAQAIVYARDVDDGTGAPGPHGPFKSLFELNMIYDPTDTARPESPDPLLRNGLRNLWGNNFRPTDPDPNDEDGDYSPEDPSGGPVDPDGVRNDFEERFMMMNRVSNLLTFRSDTFTVYVQVQGWRGVGTANPELVVQRRAAFIADRNNINQGNRLPDTVNVPTN